jgi:uncharacterized protein with HEPN domain
MMRWTARRQSEAVGRYIANRSLTDYVDDNYFRHAVERRLEKVGEALVSVRNEEPDIVSLIPDIHRIIGLRNRIVHQYDELNEEQMWFIAVEDAPRIASSLREIVNTHGDMTV